MKLIKTTSILALSIGAIASAAVKPVSAQTGYNPWTGNTYDTSECYYSNSCYVDQYGDVYGSDNWNDPYDYQYDSSGNTYYQLQ